jgi:hypothetical protein
MKKIFKSCVAAVVSTTVAICSANIYISSYAETESETTTYTFTYNINLDEIETEDADAFVSIQAAAGDNITIPDATFNIGTSYLSGWTVDDIFLYEAGDVYKMPDHDVVINPVLIDPTAELYSVTYDTDGDDYDLSTTSFKEKFYLPGQAVSASTQSIQRTGYKQLGWYWGDTYVTSSDKLIMPAEDVVFEPAWFKQCNIYYEAGDVDRIIGNSSYVFEKTESLTIDLANSSRLSRAGFTLSGWLCDIDGKVYEPVSQFVVPSTDVHFTAVWTPKTYTVVFNPNNGKDASIKISGETDTAITVPECTSVKAGYKFAGWLYDGVTYKAGEEFVIPGAAPGLGISLKAVWVEDTGEEEEIYDSLNLAMARTKYLNGEITEEELLEINDFLLGRD